MRQPWHGPSHPLSITHCLRWVCAIFQCRRLRRRCYRHHNCMKYYEIYLGGRCQTRHPPLNHCDCNYRLPAKPNTSTAHAFQFGWIECAKGAANGTFHWHRLCEFVWAAKSQMAPLNHFVALLPLCCRRCAVSCVCLRAFVRVTNRMQTSTTGDYDSEDNQIKYVKRENRQNVWVVCAVCDRQSIWIVNQTIDAQTTRNKRMYHSFPCSFHPADKITCNWLLLLPSSIWHHRRFRCHCCCDRFLQLCHIGCKHKRTQNNIRLAN